LGCGLGWVRGIDVKNVQIKNLKNVKNVKKRDKNKKNVCKHNKKRYLFLMWFNSTPDAQEMAFKAVTQYVKHNKYVKVYREAFRVIDMQQKNHRSVLLLLF